VDGESTAGVMGTPPETPKGVVMLSRSTRLFTSTPLVVVALSSVLSVGNAIAQIHC
jgi:hypothetical protein